MMSLPTSVEPVNEILLTIGWPAPGGSTDQRMPSKNTARRGRRQSRQASGGAGGFAV
jgi:hypothetical protein